MEDKNVEAVNGQYNRENLWQLEGNAGLPDFVVIVHCFLV